METSIKVNRRKFLGGAAMAGAATTVSSAEIARAATGTSGPAAEAKPSAPRPSARVAAAETGVPAAEQAQGRAGSDFMVDVIKSLDIDYVPSNPASSFRGLHESLLTYGGNKKPEFITCMHEESSVGIAHGYFKIAGKPLIVLCHGT
ncbi:MAG: acetolactate synthase large subunit, partial [Hyphomicrobiales bacterium]